jgi:hypothetical protein
VLDRQRNSARHPWGSWMAGRWRGTDRSDGRGARLVPSNVLGCFRSSALELSERYPSNDVSRPRTPTSDGGVDA